MKKIIILCIFISLQLLKLAAQQIPKIIPPSPTAQAFMRYGEIPVDYSTGVPSISIPLYTIKGKKLELPISISYHASGIKVNDVASEVGLGWVLNCGGIVSRSVFGIPDELNPIKAFSSASVLLQSAITASNIFDQSCKCLSGLVNFEDQLNGNESGQDYMSDRFSYSLPNGTSGIFRYDYSNSNNIITLPYRPLKIEKFLDTPTPGNYAKIKSFKITAENGTVYLFEPFLNNTPQYYSEWYLTKMISSDGTDVITFQYELQTSNSSIPIGSQILIGPAKDKIGCDGHPVGSLFSTLTTPISTLPSFNAPVLKTIVSSTATISFSYANDRYDFDQLRRLTDIIISPTNTPSQTIESVHFIPQYFGSRSADYRLGLNSVTISAPGNNQPQKYEFAYENQTLPPYPYKMVNASEYSYTPQYSEDYWGYYNGANSPGQVPLDFITNISDMNAFGGNRNPDSYYSMACLIKQIKYPTGGKTVFQFERNFSQNIYPYKYPGNTDGYVGGFRIAGITSYNEKNEVIGIKTYEYAGAVTKQIKRESFVIDQRKSEKVDYINYAGGNDYCYTSYSNEMIFSNPILPIEVGVGLPIMYNKVIEYNGTKTNNAGKTVYEYNQPNSPSDYINYTHPFEWELPSFYHPFHYDRGNYVPELISKTTYSFDGTSYYPVEKTKNTYTPLYTQEYLTGIKLTRNIQYSPYYFSFSLYNPNNSPLINNSETIAEYLQSIIAIDTKAYQEATLLTKSENYTYNPTDSTKYVMGLTDLEYESKYTQLTKQTTSTSVSGKNKIIQFTYPFNYTTAPYANMVGLNNITPVIEQSEYSGTNFLQATRTNYDFFQSNAIIAPSSIDLKTGSNNYETRLVYGAYDSKGNPQYICKDGATKMVYLWSYNGQYPAAKIEGISYTDMVNSYFSQSNIDILAQTPMPTDGQINVIRTALGGSGALVTTYTYKPLVGITSMTDPRGVTTNYSYDTFNRLFLARNDDKNIVGRYSYGYQNAPDNGQGGYTAPAATVTPGAASYTVGATGSATLNSITGGSGNYNYSWYLKNSSGTVLASNLNTTSTSFSYSCSQVGQLVIQCVINDVLTGILTTTTSYVLINTATPVYGSIVMYPNFTSLYQSIFITNTTVSFNLAFYSKIAMGFGATYLVGNVSANCRPLSPRTMTCSSYGFIWNIVVNPNGELYFKITNGTVVNPGNGIGFTSLSYNL